MYFYNKLIYKIIIDDLKILWIVDSYDLSLFILFPYFGLFRPRGILFFCLRKVTGAIRTRLWRKIRSTAWRGRFCATLAAQPDLGGLQPSITFAGKQSPRRAHRGKILRLCVEHFTRGKQKIPFIYLLFRGLSLFLYRYYK